MLPQRRPFAGWAGTTCVVTGGLGFIGSNLARALVAAGARVRVVDALVPTLGGRADHLDGVGVDSVLIASIADPRVADVVEDADVVFNVAGQVSHTASMRDPQQDLALNTTSHATFLDMIKRVCPSARVIYTSTRQVYGRSMVSTVDETHAVSPVDVNGVAKLAGEQLHLVYAHAYGIAATALRLTNVYGPRQRLTSDELGFLPVFVRKALLDEPIEIFGDGTQRRDCLHVDDVVGALVATAEDVRATGLMFNVGHPDTHTVAEIAEAVTTAAGGTAGVRLVDWPGDRALIDIGSFHTGSARIAAALGWRATIGLHEGLCDTVAFYREHPWYLSST
jgi:UDP-glucose 4-epimerase